MTRQQTNRRNARLFPLGLDGEPVTDPTFAIPLPADFQAWEEVVANYLAARTAELLDAA
jgi:hypothetical protein